MKLGISRGYLSLLVNGKRPHPSSRTRSRLLEGFGLRFADLFEFEPDPPSDREAEQASCRLAVYGSLAPGEANHHHLANLPGTWSEGWVEGVLHDRGWGARLGFPGIELRPSERRVPVQLLESDELPAHWARLDAFEGDEYRRTLVPVHRSSSAVVLANIYVLGR